MKRREFLKMIEAAGWSFVRHGGDHDVYGRHRQTFAVPRHTEIRPGIIRQWQQKDRKAEEDGP
ncbi:MAG: type II toxin-antitoxin system HicA family toxin [Candidatus Xenobium sp.]|jgi:mRNA interferase HicA|nr:type II toxin-antitoxin system HicA family toxin [Burkholderiales bacterium]